MEVHFKLFGIFLAIYSSLDLHCTDCLYTFFHGVHNFCPRHCQRSFIDIFFNPVPQIEFEGHTTESNDFDSLKRRRFNHNLIAHQIVQNKYLSAKRMTQSSFALVYDCPMANVSPIAPKLHGYQTYTMFHDTSMEHQVIHSEKSMPMTLYFAICKFLCLEIVFPSYLGVHQMDLSH
jgi:hypothetical protein